MANQSTQCTTVFVTDDKSKFSRLRFHVAMLFISYSLHVAIDRDRFGKCFKLGTERIRGASKLILEILLHRKSTMSSENDETCLVKVM